MISEDQVSRFKRDGFLLIDGPFGAEKLAEMRMEFESSKEEIKNYSGWAFMGMFRHSSVYRQFIAESGAIALAKKIFSCDSVDLYWDSVVVKSANNRRQFCWHQDEGYTLTKPQEYITFWIPFQDVTDKNGGLWVLPGSHNPPFLSVTS